MADKTENQKFYETPSGKIILRNRLASLKLNVPFLQVFKVRLKTFWLGNLLGLDIIAFDQFIQPEENESCLDATRRRFDQEGVDIIRELLGMKNER